MKGKDCVEFAGAIMQKHKSSSFYGHRETYKIGVIYVGHGDARSLEKSVILSEQHSNSSKEYRDFIDHLGKVISLNDHVQFSGGLLKDGTISESVYWSDDLTEVMFHVATLMPSQNEEDFIRKIRFIGNDDVHIVWCDGLDCERPSYHRSVISTNFADCVFAIYTLKAVLHKGGR
ncbi:hypothetical protein ACOME3_004152 [Neoechinorhynchus agilis]